MRKLGFNANTEHLADILQPELSPHFRFCPECLLENQVESLHWRFRLIRGCSLHKLNLLERCPECGGSIPYVPYMDKTVCPVCSYHLADAQAPNTPKNEIDGIEYRTKTLCYLMNTYDWEHEMDKLIPFIGKRLGLVRSEKDLSIPAISKLTDVAEASLWQIERGDLPPTGIGLTAYIRYCEALDIDIEVVHKQAWRDLRDSLLLYTVSSHHIGETLYYGQVLEVAADLFQRGIEPTSDMIAYELGMEVASLNYYKKIQTFFQQLREQNKHNRKIVLANRLRKVIQQLVAADIPPSQDRIAQTIGTTGGALRRQRKFDKNGHVTAVLEEAKEAGRKSILLLVRRGGDPRFVALVLEE